MTTPKIILDAIATMEWNIKMCDNVILKKEGERNAYTTALLVIEHLLSEEDKLALGKAKGKKQASQSTGITVNEALRAKKIEAIRKGDHSFGENDG